MSEPPPHPPERAASAHRRPSKWRRRLLLYPVLLYVIWCAMLFFLQDRLLFPRHMVAPAPPGGLAAALGWHALSASQPAGPRPERIAIEVEGGQVTAWFAPAPQASSARPAPLAVLFHGNAELADHMAWHVRQYHAMGCSVLVPEYRGYGDSAGSPSQEAIVADAVRFYDAALSRADVDRAQIVFHGISLGGGVAAQLAARRKPAALILQSSFASVAVMARKYLAPAALATSPFRTDEILPALDIPVFIAHGTRDTIVPIWHAHRLRGLARNLTYVEYDCGHNDLPPPGRENDYWQKIATFLRDADVLESQKNR